METTRDRSGMQRWVIAGLLALILIAQLYSIYSTYQRDQLERVRAATYEARVEEAQQVIEQQRDVISGLVSDYERTAYDNPNLERITEQQLIAAEYQIIALQAIALQNTQIVELLAAAP